jgi:putative Holliday junction resolvase
MDESRPDEQRSPRGRVLAIDPGQRRVGLAVSDPERRVAHGLATFESEHGRSFIDHLRELLQAYEVRCIVVGQPLTMRGRVGAAAARSGRLARRLRRELGIDVELWDERLTTAQGERLLRGQRAPRGARDRIAATLILQSYLDRLDRKKP